MQEYVLSGGEVVRLKHYIEHKHASLDPKQRASVLADAVHRIIESRLPSFPDEVKKRVCHDLLMKHRDSLIIQADDVLQYCMSLDLSNEDLLSSLAVWVCSKSSVPVQEEDARNIVHRWSQQRLPTVSLQVLEQEWGQNQNQNQNQDQQDQSVGKELAVASEPVVPYRNKQGFNRRIAIAMACFFVVILAVLLILPLDRQSSAPSSYADPINILPPTIKDNGEMQSGIPTVLKYVSIDTKRLQQYLRNRNSLLAEEPYLSAIVEASKEYDVHPLLLFAITGQEQGFVRKNHKSVEKIANNPFNVFGSWESYNTTIAGSATIAAKTVANISGRRPAGNHPIQWLNQTYAEDPNWWKGVTWFFDEMKREIEDESFEWPE